MLQEHQRVAERHLVAALPGSGADITDERVDIATLVVHGVRASGAVVDMPHEFRVERA